MPGHTLLVDPASGAEAKLVSLELHPKPRATTLFRLKLSWDSTSDIQRLRSTRWTASRCACRRFSNIIQFKTRLFMLVDRVSDVITTTRTTGVKGEGSGAEARRSARSRRSPAMTRSALNASSPRKPAA